MMTPPHSSRNSVLRSNAASSRTPRARRQPRRRRYAVPGTATRARRSPWPVRLVNLAAVLILVGAVLSLFPLGVLAFEVAHDGRIYPGIRVAGVDVGGCTPEEALARVEAVYAEYATRPLTLQHDEQEWLVTPAELGLRVDAGPSIAAAFAVGRSPDVVASLRDQAKAALTGYTFEPAVRFDAQTLVGTLNRLAGNIDRTGGEATIQVHGLHVALGAGQSGRRLNLDRTAAVLLSICQARSYAVVPLAVDESAPVLADERLAPAVVAAERILAGPIVLTLADSTGTGAAARRTITRTWALDEAILVDALWFSLERDDAGHITATARLDESPLRSFVQGIAAQVDQPARDARFDLDPTSMTLTPILTSQVGRTVDVTATVQAIQVAALSTGTRVVPLSTQTSLPAVDMSDPAALGIRELLSTGQTQFAGSTAERIHNIEITAQRLHGVVVPPGGVFSFIEPLGNASEADGYQEAYIIYGDRTVVGIGGGVCQVSTTCYRAAWWAGLPILERTPHAFRISWYEPPLGMDATVFAPTVDLKFQNDTPAYLLIQTEVDRANSTLTFRFYGTRPDRVVEMEGPYTSNVIPAPAPIYENDPTLPRGTTKQVGSAHDGVDVTTYRVIKQNGQVIERERFFTRFQPWAARYLVGTKE